MKRKWKWDEAAGILFFIMSFFMLCVSVYLCFSSDIWYDELFTMGLGSQSPGELIDITAQDVHPPLYYLIVRLFILGAGGSYSRRIIAAKLASVLPFFLCEILAATVIRKRFGMLCAGFFSFLLLSMPQLSQYTVEIRMYGYALFFITAAMLCACRLGWEKLPERGQEKQSERQKQPERGQMQQPQGQKQQKRKEWATFLLLAVFALLACYTHYFACVAAVMIYLVLFLLFLWQKRIRKMLLPWLLSGGICAVGYLPWLVGVVSAQVERVSENYWIQPVSLRTLAGCVKFLFLPAFSNEKLNLLLAAVCVLVYGGLLVLAFLDMRRDRKKQKAGEALTGWQEAAEEGGFPLSFVLGLLGILTGLVFFGMLVSILLRPIFVYRYMLPAMGGFWLAFALLAAAQKKRRWLIWPVLLLFAIIGIRNFRAFYGEEMWKRVCMEQTQEALTMIEEEDILIFNFDQTQGVVTSYLPNETYLWYGEPEALIRRMYPANHELVEGEFSDEKGMERIKGFLEDGKSVWFLGSGNARDEIREKWSKEGIFTEECSSVLLERYWFNIYRVTLG